MTTSSTGNTGDQSPHTSTGVLAERIGPQTPEQRMVVDVQARTVAKVLALLFVFTVGLSLLESVRTVLIWFGIAMFLAIALNPAVALAERRMPRTPAVLLVFATFVVGLLVIIGLLVEPFVSQIDNLVTAAPHAAETVSRNPLVHRLDQQYHLAQKAREHASDLPRIAFGAAGSIVSGVTATITVLFLTAFILFELPRMGEVVLSQLRPTGADRARQIGGHINRNVGGYVVGNLLISVIAGLVAFVLLWLVGVPYALTLGVVVAIGDLIPLVGATLASIIVVAAAYFTVGTTDAIIVFAVIMVYQQIENHVLQPIVYRRTIQIPSLIVLIAVLAGASLLGIIGALVAIPVAGTLYTVFTELLEARAERLALEAEG